MPGFISDSPLARGLTRIGDEAIAREDDARLRDYYTADYVFRGPGGDLSFDGLGAYFASLRAAFSNMRIVREQIIADGRFLARAPRPRRRWPRPATAATRLAASIAWTRKEIVMPVIVVTRLRLRDPALLDEFFTDAVAAIEQAMKAEGNLGVDALADANNAWWSVSAWQERRLMQAYVDSEPHLGIKTRLDHFCDEATFVDWDQASPDLPDWQTSWRHLTADGKAAELTHPSAANQTRDFPPPVQPPPSVS